MTFEQWRIKYWRTDVPAEIKFSSAYNAGIKQGQKEALDAVFQINGPSRAIKQLREKFGLEI